MKSAMFTAISMIITALALWGFAVPPMINAHNTLIVLAGFILSIGGAALVFGAIAIWASEWAKQVAREQKQSTTTTEEETK